MSRRLERMSNESYDGLVIVNDKKTHVNPPAKRVSWQQS